LARPRLRAVVDQNVAHHLRGGREEVGARLPAYIRVPAGSNGAVSVFATDSTDLILDINGYFVAGSFPGALAFHPLTPCRVADTRNPTDPLGGPSLEAESTRSFPILASSCGVPPEAEAYSLNLAAVPRGPNLGYMTV
jgi:hypothetical protein